MKAFAALFAFVWLVNQPWVLALLGSVVLAVLAFCAWRFVQDFVAVKSPHGPWSRVEPSFEWAKEQEASHRSRAHDDAASKASDGVNHTRGAAEAAHTARIAELLDKNKKHEEKLVELRKRIRNLEAEAANVPARIQEAVNSGREEVLHAFGHRREDFERMLREFVRKEQAQARHERSRQEEQQRQERQRREDAARTRREQAQRRTRSSKAWWEVLGVRADASEDEVRRAYRFLARRYHPDRQDTGNTTRMAEINAARDEAVRRFRRAA